MYPVEQISIYLFHKVDNYEIPIGIYHPNRFLGGNSKILPQQYFAYDVYEQKLSLPITL